MRTSPERRLSLAHLTCLHVPPPDLVRLAADTGFDAVGALRLTPTSDGRGHPMLGDSPMRRQTVAALRETGLSVLDVEVHRLRAEPTDPEPLLAAGAELGAAYVLVTVEDTEPERRVQALGELADRARSYGLRVMVEPMVFSAVHTPAQAVAALGDSGGGVLIDTLHLARAGCGPEDLDGLDPDLLPYAQLCDAPSAGPARSTKEAVREAVGERLPPGEGVLPLAEVVARLPPDAPLSLEVPHPESLVDPYAWCRRLVAAAAPLRS